MSADTIFTAERIATGASSGTRVARRGKLLRKHGRRPLAGRLSAWVGRTCWSVPRLAWVVLDVVLAGLGVYVGFIEVGWFQYDLGSHVAFPVAWAVIAAALTFSGLIFGWYELDTLLHRSRIAARSILTVCLAIIGAYIAIEVCMYAELSRRISLAFIVTFLGVSVPARILAYSAIQRYKRGLVIVGSSESAACIVDSLRNPGMQCYRLVGFVSVTDKERSKQWYGYPVWPSVNDIERICVEHDVQEIVVDNRHEADSSVFDAVLSCLRIGCRVTNQSTFFEKAFGQIPVEHITPNWFLFADLQVYHIDKTSLKRFFDVLASLLGLIVTFPLWPVIALVVWVDSGAPVFYSQLRVGQNGTLFRLYKFRTMRVQSKAAATWAADDDPRITRVGRILRRSHLDELPQLWNILCGQMSLVGPRPEQPDLVRQLAARIPYYNERHLIKPGLTGWAQINFGYGNSVEDARHKLQLDLYYVKHMSLELDMTILFRTLGKLFYSEV